MYRRQLQEERRKDEAWKETKRKQAELEAKRRQGQTWQAIKYKDLKKEEFLSEIDHKKSKFYSSKKEDRQAKEELIRAKQMEDQQHI